MYAKAENVRLEDFFIQCDPNAKDMGSAFSVRDAGFYALRFDVESLFAFAVYEHTSTVGTITFQDGQGKSYHSDTSCWIDTTRAHNIIFRNVSLNGPGLFARASTAFPGTITCIGCYKNGLQVTPQDFNLPASRLTIS